MALTEEVLVDQIMVNEDGIIHHRTTTKIFRDGVEIAKSYHRGTIVPGDNPVALGVTDQRVLSMVDLFHDQATKDKYLAKIAASREAILAV